MNSDMKLLGIQVEVCRISLSKTKEIAKSMEYTRHRIKIDEKERRKDKEEYRANEKEEISKEVKRQ